VTVNVHHTTTMDFAVGNDGDDYDVDPNKPELIKSVRISHCHDVPELT